LYGRELELYAAKLLKIRLRSVLLVTLLYCTYSLYYAANGIPEKDWPFLQVPVKKFATSIGEDPFINPEHPSIPGKW
jgi:hypothetical protein